MEKNISLFYKYRFVIIVIIYLSSSNLNSMITDFFPKKSTLGIISIPIADLQTRPINTDTALRYPILSYSNPYQDSQLLFGETLEIIEVCREWMKVRALEQTQYSIKSKKWDYKTGWIKKKQVTKVDTFPDYNLITKTNNALIYYRSNENQKILPISIGTKLKVLQLLKLGWIKIMLPHNKTGLIHRNSVKLINTNQNINTIREHIIQTAQTFLNTPYSWGGRSSYNSKNQYQRTGVDCSGLTNLIYRINGFNIPRDAKDQYLACTHIPELHLEKGDLIFIKDQIINKIVHVIIYEGIKRDSNGKYHKFVMENTGAPDSNKKCKSIKYKDFCKTIGSNKKLLFGSILKKLIN